MPTFTYGYRLTVVVKADGHESETVQLTGQINVLDRPQVGDSVQLPDARITYKEQVYLMPGRRHKVKDIIVGETPVILVFHDAPHKVRV